jgi:hypothetical protein
MRDTSVVRVSTRIQVAMGGLLMALGVVMWSLVPAAEQAQVTLLAGLAGLGGLMGVSARAERLR